MKLGVLAHFCSFNTREVEAGGSRVGGQLECHREKAKVGEGHAKSRSDIQKEKVFFILCCCSDFFFFLKQGLSL